MLPQRLVVSALALALTACGDGGGGGGGGASPSPVIAPTSVQRVDTRANGSGGGGDATSPRISADNRWVVFASTASDLVDDDTNGVRDVFRKDLQSGALRLVSRNDLGTPGNGASDAPAISADGSWVVFASDADNLVAGDTNGVSDVFVVQVETGIVQRVSVAADGSQGAGASGRPDISRDGAWIAFESAATNLVPGDTNGRTDVFRRQRAINDLALMSRNALGGIGSQDAVVPRLARDLAVTGDPAVVFHQTRTPGSADDVNGLNDVYMAFTGGLARRSPPLEGSGDANGHSEDPWPSGDARYVAFRSNATNLTTNGGTGFYADVFLYDRVTLTTERVSQVASSPSVSDDGRFVGFVSSGALVGDDRNLRQDLYVLDRTRARTFRVSTTATGVENDRDCWNGSLSADGSRAVFAADGNVLTPGGGTITHVYVAVLPPLSSG